MPPLPQFCGSPPTSRTRLTTLARTTGLLLLAALAPAANAQRVNLAKFQNVSVSEFGGTYSAEFAVDGIVSNFHTHRTGTPTQAFWLEVTYAKPVTIASAHLYSGLPINATTGQIFTSFRYQYHDGNAWVDIPGGSVTGNTSPEVAKIFTQAITATRFRLYSTDTTNPANQRSVRELALFPPNLVNGVEAGYPLGTDVVLSLAHQRPSTATSADTANADGPGYARNAFDGYLDNTSRWLGTTTTGDTLEVDLLVDHRVGSAHVHSGYQAPGDATRSSTQPCPEFTLQYFDGTTWQPVPGGTITGNTQVARVVPFSSDVTTSKIRLLTTSASNGRIQELLLFPPRAGGYPAGLEVLNQAPPTATWDRYSDSLYRLRNNGPDLRLGLVGGVVVHTTTSTVTPEQTEWQLLLNHRDGSYRIRHAQTGLCLAQASLSRTAGTAVVAETYSALPHQDWLLVYTDATTCSLVNVFSGLVLQPHNGSWANGATFSVAAAVPGSTAQLWTPTLIRHFPKKGVAGTTTLIRTSTTPYVTDSDLTFHEDLTSRLNGAWSYGWGRQPSSQFPYLDANHAYNPMQWGDFSWTQNSTQGPPENLYRELQSTSKAVHYLGFNEPESTSQGYILPADAVTRWPRLMALDAPLVAPVPASIQYDSSVNPAVPADGWMKDFVTAADARGYRRDYTAVHWYASPNSTSLINHLENIYEAYGRPVWLTEFSVVRWSGTARWTLASNYNFLAEFLWRAESLPWLKRYSVFPYIQDPPATPNSDGLDSTDAPRSNTLRSDGTLTAFGELYAGWDGVASVLNTKSYHLHNKSVYRRVQNPGQPQTPPERITSISPEETATGTQWFLIPGTTTDTVRIVSTIDGRRIRYFTGVSVALVAASNFTGQSEWRLVPDQYGWYFLFHPQSGARLRMDTAGTLLPGSGTGTGDDYKWRFVAPAKPDSLAPPAAPQNLVAQPSTTSIALTWTASPGATTYAVSRATDPAGTWTTLSSSLTSTAYTDTTAALGTLYSYRVTATNILAFTSAASTSVASARLTAAPTGLSLQATSRTVALSWPAVAGAASYGVARASAAVGPWTTVASSLAATNWSDTNLAPQTAYFYRLVATNVQGLDSAPSDTATITTLSAFAEWTQTNLGSLPVGDQQPDADPDGDGLPNLLEYALAAAPTSPSAAQAPAVSLAPGATQLTLRFLRARAELTYAIEASPDLVQWTVVATNPGSVSESTPVAFVDPQPVGSGNPPNRFLRLRVTTL